VSKKKKKKMSEKEIGHIRSLTSSASVLVEVAQVKCRHPYKYLANSGGSTPYMCCSLCRQEGVAEWEHKE